MTFHLRKFRYTLIVLAILCLATNVLTNIQGVDKNTAISNNFEQTTGITFSKQTHNCRQQGLWPKEVTGHDPDKEPKAFDPFCPIRNVTKDYPPTLLLHGDKDTDVPFQQSVLMSKELERHRIGHELIILPNRGHGFDRAGEGMKDPVTAETFDRVLAFLKKLGAPRQ